MKYSEKTMLEFYQQLGKVFYAAAAADRVISKEEVRVLRNIVRADWLDFENTFDEFGTDSAYQIEIVFDWLADKKINPRTAISDFESFILVHPSLFTDKVKHQIIKTITTITGSFNGTIQSELRILGEIDTLLDRDR